MLVLIGVKRLLNCIVHYPNEQWFKPGRKDALPKEILDAYCLDIYNPDGELRASHLVDTNSRQCRAGDLFFTLCAAIGW